MGAFVWALVWGVVSLVSLVGVWDSLGRGKLHGAILWYTGLCSPSSACRVIRL